MKKVGYLSKKKVSNKTYIYIRKSFRENKKIKHEYIYSFGSMPGALEKMYWLRDHPELFPNELADRGFDFSDLYDWILTMETGVTSTGRDFNI